MVRLVVLGRHRKLKLLDSWLMYEVYFLVIPEEAPYLEQILVPIAFQKQRSGLQLLRLLAIKALLGYFANRGHDCRICGGRNAPHIARTDCI